jgi:multidrug resistance efflux pump
MATLTKKASVQLFAVAAVGILLAALTSAFLMAERQPGSSDASAAEPAVSEDTGQASESIPVVKVIRPRRDPDFRMTVSAPAYVEAYYKAALKAKVSGPVKFVQKDIGAHVKKGEVLAEIDVPDLIQGLAQAEKVIQQRQQEKSLADTKVGVAKAAVDAATSSWHMKEKLKKAAEAIRDFRWTRYTRLKTLSEQNAVSELLAEEGQMDYLGAYAAYEAALEAVTQAQAKLEEAKQNLQVANADVVYKQSLVDVAEKDRDRAKALADYTKIEAPFDGVIVKRNVDPGSFVDVGTANSDPLFIIERSDIVTVYMKVPDSLAPNVTDGTEAIITMTEWPGVEIHGRVSRHDPSLETSHTDLTMRVEVDLWNQSRRKYAAWLASEQAKQPPVGVPFDDLKKGDDPTKPVIPLVPTLTNSGATSPRLLPGMYGTMQLVLRTFRNTYLLPSDVIVQQGGEHYIYLFKDGVAKKVQVEVQADDERLAKVVKIVKKGGQEVREELTNRDVVIKSGLSDVSDGQAVKADPTDW